VFARRGAELVLGCRDAAKGAAALQRIEEESRGARVELLELDLASLASVQQAARRFAQGYARLHVLCNNAGVMAIPRALTVDGFEMQFGVNHLGHFALTGWLFERLLAAGDARIVTVSSSAHRIGRIAFDDIDGARSYQEWLAYGQSKLANLLFAFELQRRLAARGLSAISVACHPGYADTNLQQVAPTVRGSRVGAAFFKVSNALFAQSAARGAWPTLYAATAPDVQGGDYIGPSGVGELMGAPKRVRARRSAYDPELARRLWELSVQRTGVDPAA
jgi:NAD(P)-dependent dehydrogenase (short-subunit alcohol dehydrogenase family)